MCITRQWRAGSRTRASFQQGVPPHLRMFLPHYLLQIEKPWNVWHTFTISVYGVHSPSQCMMDIYHHSIWCTFTITVYDVHLPSQCMMYIYHHSVRHTFTITVYDTHLPSQCPTLVMHTDSDRNQQQSDDTNSLHSNTDQIQIICASCGSAQYHMVVRSKACEEGLGAWYGTHYNTRVKGVQML